MTKTIEKVAAYITWANRLLVFRQPHAPEAGVQVPAGTVEDGELLEAAVLREAQEETGLKELTIVSYLGQQEYQMRDAHERPLLVRRHFFHLRLSGEAPERWQHLEMTPSGGVEDPILFELWWVAYPEEVPPLAGQQSQFLNSITQIA
jgi:ADP-ribose pyrophosphatase YjhB (NUDIX family)